MVRGVIVARLGRMLPGTHDVAFSDFGRGAFTRRLALSHGNQRPEAA